MQKLSLLSILFLLIGCTPDIQVPPENRKPPTVKNSFQAVWNILISDPIQILPQKEISSGKLSTGKRDIILEDAKRTLAERADILQPFEKLAHPNGICFKGLWNIDTKTPYSGYFKQHSKALIIARASSAMSRTKQGEIRSFGFAGKLFPTTNPRKVNKAYSANFFVIDDLGGTDAKHYTDVAMTNEPEVSITREVIKNLLYVLNISSAFQKADKHPTIRQLYEISELGEKKGSLIITPKWLKLEARRWHSSDASDFRTELTIRNGKKLVFNISVASQIIDGKRDWRKIGTITLDTSILSNACDQRLHFHHPPWRDDLTYLR